MAADPSYVWKYSGSCCFVDCHVFRRINSSLECGECLFVDESPKYYIGLLHAWLEQDSSLNLPELPQRYIAAPDGLDESRHS